MNDEYELLYFAFWFCCGVVVGIILAAVLL